MHDIVRDRTRLLRRSAELESRIRQSDGDPAVHEALAEVCFRLALLRGAAPRESVALLRRAIRLDGTNPKHAYALARLYLAHGDLDRAAAWLRRCVAICPTSHRVWTHVALVQHELNLRYRGNDQFDPDDLRRRAIEVLDRVRRGRDTFPERVLAFRPRQSAKARAALADARERGAAADALAVAEVAEPAAPRVDLAAVTRYADPRICRWSGAADVPLEQKIAGTPSEQSCRQARPLLQQAARTAADRTGGTAGFAVLAVQWCVAGFPPETVAALRLLFPPSGASESLRLVDIVSRCFRERPAKAPALIADALSRDVIPPMLAALLHHRCVLWQGVDVRLVVRYRAGRRWLERSGKSSASAGRADEIRRGLDQAAASLEPKPRPVLADPAASAPRPAGDRAAALASVEDAVTRLSACRGTASRRATGPVVSVELQAWTAVAQALDGAAERASSRLDDVIAGAYAPSAGPPSDDFASRCARARRALNGMLYLAPFAPPEARRADEDVAPGAVARTELAALEQGAAAILSVAAAGAADAPASQLAALEAESVECKSRLDADWTRLESHAKAKAVVGLSEAAIAECHEISQYVEDFAKRGDASLRRIADLRSTGKLRDWSGQERKDAERPGVRALPRSEVERLADVESAFRALLSSPGRFRRRLASLSLPKKAPAATTAAGPGADKAAGPGEAKASEPAVAGGADGEGPAGVERALAVLEKAIARRFDAALSTFDAYTSRQLDSSALGALQWSVRARQAEAMYRIGREAAARAIWSRMRREARNCPEILRNVAVSLTGQPEMGRELGAWRDYAESLYHLDGVDASPRTRARERADFHRSFGSAYAPGMLGRAKDEPEPTESDESDLLAFIESPLRARTFVAHKRLEWLNAKLCFRSPPLVLGCRREDPERVREAAAAKLVAYARDCAAVLPERVRARFVAAVESQVKDALEACRQVRRLTATGDADYAEEAPRQTQWVEDVWATKLRISSLLLRSREAVRRTSSLDFLAELVRLDDVPLDLSPAILSAVARSRDVQRPPELLAAYVAQVRARFLELLAKFLTEVPADEQGRALRVQQLRRASEEWAGSPALRGVVMFVRALCAAAEASALGTDHALTAKLAIAILHADDRTADAASLAIVTYHEAADPARGNLQYDDLVRATTDWIARARRHVEESIDEAESAPLTHEAVDQVHMALANALVESVLKPFGESPRARAKTADLKQALESVGTRFPIARPVRALTYWNFGAEASKESRRDEALAWFKLCRGDVKAVLADRATPAKARELAEQLQTGLADVPEA